MHIILCDPVTTYELAFPSIANGNLKLSLHKMYPPVLLPGATGLPT